MRVPKNIIKEAQYTSGGEFINPAKTLYKGYYYELNGKYFTGKTYSKDSIPLTKIDTFKGNPFVSKLINQLLQQNKANQSSNNLNKSINKNNIDITNNLIIASPLSLSRLPVGSSAKMIRGWFIKALAIATLCCCPPDSSFG
mgnify:CR=1 FL=1